MTVGEKDIDQFRTQGSKQVFKRQMEWLIYHNAHRDADTLREIDAWMQDRISRIDSAYEARMMGELPDLPMAFA